MLGKNSYGCLNKCYLRPEAAQKVCAAQRLLKKRYPGYSLKILEGTRPRQVQKKMFEAVKNTALQKYVADPARGSMHNYGAAVDITILDKDGKEPDMGKPDPRIKTAGRSDLEIKVMFALNRVSKKQKKTRMILKETMLAAGFRPVSYEWWHFDAFEKGYVRKNFKIVE
jgi:D-alanyl-D-alanine dipeptidase